MAKQSLVSKSAGATLPSTFVEDEVAVLPPLHTVTPYLVFLHPKQEAYAKVISALPDAQEGDPILMTADGPVLVNPLRFYLVHARTHYSEVTADGMTLRSTTDPEKAKEDKNLREHVETVLLVVTPDGLTPCRATFKGPKLKAVHNAVAAKLEAATPEWGKKSKEHEASLVAPDPRFRFTANVRMTTRTSRNNGFKYVEATSFPKPTGVADWKMVAAFFGNPDNVKRCDEVVENWKDRLAAIAAKGV